MTASTVSKAEFDALFAQRGAKTWAYLLQLRQQRGETLNRNQIRCFCNALKLNLPAL